MDRAMKFYSAIFGVEMQKMDWQGIQMAFFPGEKGSVHGALVQGQGYVPSDKGTIVYLNGSPDLNTACNNCWGASLDDAFRR